MSEKNEPKITACSASENWTCITFKPDLERFEMSGLEEDTISLFRKRVYDMAGVLGKTVKVQRSRNGLQCVAVVFPGVVASSGELIGLFLVLHPGLLQWQGTTCQRFPVVCRHVPWAQGEKSTKFKG